MNCSTCPDREICFKSNSVGESVRDYARYKETFLRTLRCRKQRFG